MNTLIKQNQILLASVLMSTLITSCGTQSAHQQDKPNAKTQINSKVSLNIAELAQVQEITDNKISQTNEQKIRLNNIKKRETASNLRSRNKGYHYRHIMPAIQSSPVYSSDSHPYNNIQDNENYAHYKTNTVKQTSQEPVSTFSIDVDTGSYSNVRRLLNSGTLPVKDAVRIEEMLNYFQYSYNRDINSNAPFITQTEIAPNPWAKGHHLLQIGIKAIDTDEKELPAANLVFLIDVSGSMSSPDKLGLLKKSLSLLVSKMRAEDKISLVVYAGASGIVLKPTSGSNKSTIINAISRLSSGGSTNGASGIRLAYQVAQEAYIKNGINRIMLATDGDFNVGTVNFNQLINLVEEKRKTGISLSTLGFGTGNYNDRLMEQLADAANGQYSYIDTLKEAQKVLIDEMSSSLRTVAKDVKIQIEFNPSVISEYRLIGYENRKLNNEDFNNDKVDAGDIGAGHTVTALYDIVLSKSKHKQIDVLRYQHKQSIDIESNNELAFIKLRYKTPVSSKSILLSHPVYITDILDKTQTSNNFRFASSIIGFGSLLKNGQHWDEFNYDDVIKLAIRSKGNDEFGYRGEFIQLVKLAKSLNMTAMH